MRHYQTNPLAHISMNQQPLMRDTLTRLINQLGITRAVETGTYEGTGSTRILLDAFRASKAGLFFITTMEASWSVYKRAKANLKGEPVNCLWGLSVPAQAAIDAIRNDEMLANHEQYPDIYIDNTADPRGFYLAEVAGKLNAKPEPDQPGKMPDDLLVQELLRDVGTPIILLDSAGAIGWLEFQVAVAAMGDRPYVVVLDDCNHIKHYRSVQWMEKQPEDYVFHARCPNGRWVIAERVAK